MIKYLLLLNVYFLSQSISALELTVSKGSYEYHEPNLMQITGSTVGIEASHDVYINKNMYVKLQGYYGSIDANYLAHNNGAQVVGMNDDIKEYSVSLARDFQLSGLKVTPSIGVARYKLNNYMSSSGTPNALSGGTYDRHQIYNYNPLSISLEKDDVYLKYTNKNFKDGNILSRLSQTGIPIYWYDLTCYQSKGFGSKVELGVKKGNLELAIFNDKWNIEDSDYCAPFNMAIEPKNKTIHKGLRLTYLF